MQPVSEGAPSAAAPPEISLPVHKRDRRASFVAEDFEVEEVEDVLPPWITTRSLCCLEEGSPIRKRCETVVNSDAWLYASIGMIIVSIVAVIYTAPVSADEFTYESEVAGMNAIVAIFFMADVMLRSVVSGFLFTPEAYMLSVWNVLDFLILLIDYAALVSSWPYYTMRAVRMAIATRPARIISRNRSMQVLLSSFFATLPTVFSVLLLGAVVFLCFAIIGVRLFGGLFYACNNPAALDKVSCVGTFVNSVGLTVPAVWENPESSFDDIADALMTLLEVASLDGWVEVLYTAMDIRGRDQQPLEDESWYAAIYFVLFICIGSYFIIRTIVGVLIDQFGYLSGSKLLTERQKLWRDMYRIALNTKPVTATFRPVSHFGGMCYDLAKSKAFHYTTLCVLVLNGVILAMTWHGQSDEWTDTQKYLDALFVMFYLVEFVIKLCASSPMAAWRRNGWNWFELVILVGSLATIMAEEDTFRLQAGRPFKFLRVFRVISFSQSLGVLLNTMWISVPSLLSIVGMYAIWVFLYAGIGTQSFPEIKYGAALNRTRNFESFTSAFILLFQVMTGEGWRDLMYDVTRSRPYCTINDELDVNDCGFEFAGRFYFVTFVIVCAYLITNLFVAALLDNVTFGLLRESSIVTPHHISEFQKAWSQIDPKATGYIGLHRLPELLEKIGAPLGNAKITPAWIRPILYECFTVHERGKGLPFNEVLEVLLAVKLGPSALTIDVRIKREKELAEVFNWGAAVRAQAMCRGYFGRKKAWLLREARAAAQGTTDGTGAGMKVEDAGSSGGTVTAE